MSVARLISNKIPASSVYKSEMRMMIKSVRRRATLRISKLFMEASVVKVSRLTTFTKIAKRDRSTQCN